MEIAIVLVFITTTLANSMEGPRIPIEAFRPSAEFLLKRPDKMAFLNHHRPYLPSKTGLKILYQVGRSDEELPLCRAKQVCNKVDLYESGRPWIEKRCRCNGHRPCSSSLSPEDGHTLSDKTTMFKLCEPVKRLNKCRYFKDPAWTLFSSPDSNTTQQIVNCHCPKNSMTYLLKKQTYATSSGKEGHQYHFACSPQSRLRCSRKEPCKLFSVRKRHEHIDEVNASNICQCPHGHTCPRHHTEAGVLLGVTYPAEDIRTFNGYCLPETPPESNRFSGNQI